VQQRQLAGSSLDSLNFELEFALELELYFGTFAK